MKKLKVLSMALLLGIFATCSMTKVNAIGWKSTLNLSYGDIYTSPARPYIEGTNKIMISVDGFNKSNGTVRKSGTTTMELALHDVATGRHFKYDTHVYTYGTCDTRNMGSYSAGHRDYTFLSSIYNDSTGGRDNYDGIKSNLVYMYPAPKN